MSFSDSGANIRKISKIGTQPTQEYYYCLVLCYVATGFTAGLAIVSAVLTQAHIVIPHAKHAVFVARTVSLVFVTLHAGKLVGHRFTLTRSFGNEKRTVPEARKGGPY